MDKRAALFGATGLVGSHVLKLLLESEAYSEVQVFARKSTEVQHAKLKEEIGDLLDKDFFKNPVQADDIFCCVGTTQAKTPDLEHYKAIDYGIPVRAAELGLKGGMKRFLVVSSIGANAESRLFYSRTKGQMENALCKMSIPRLHIFRPSLILGQRPEFRFGERAARIFAKALKLLIPKKYRGIEAKTIARAMVKVANSGETQRFYESDEIVKVTISGS